MAAVPFPAISPSESATAFVDNAAIVRPPLGGAAQRLARLGSRWGVSLVFPPMEATNARAAVSALLAARAAGETLIVGFPVPAQTASFGSLLVNGASQAGTGLIVDGGTGGATVPAGYFFNVTVGGRKHLYMTTEATTLSGGGAGTLKVSPMLRGSPADNAALSFTPVIEGFPEGAEQGWSLSTAMHTGLSFQISEAE